MCLKTLFSIKVSMNNKSNKPVIISGILSIVFLSCLFAPIIKKLLIMAGQFMPVLAPMSEFEMHRILSRLVMILGALFIIIFRKRLFQTGGIFTVLKPHKKDSFFYSTGFLLGLLTLTVQIAFAITFDARELFFSDETLLKFIKKASKAVFTASLIGFIEEFFFRGILFNSFKKRFNLWQALFLSSFLYAIMHFFKPKEITGLDETSILSGFVVLGEMLKPFSSPDFLSKCTGLFLTGFCLAYAYHRTKSLYFSIGLHAGWVFIIKVDGTMVTRTVPEQMLWWGSSQLVGGIYTWLLLIFIVFIIHVTTKRYVAKTK